jgi:uncharacterized protein YpmB
METAYVDEKKGQAICVWEAPDQQAIDDLFAKAQVTPESVRQVVMYQQ